MISFWIVERRRKKKSTNNWKHTRRDCTAFALPSVWFLVFCSFLFIYLLWRVRDCIFASGNMGRELFVVSQYLFIIIIIGACTPGHITFDLIEDSCADIWYSRQTTCALNGSGTDLQHQSLTIVFMCSLTTASNVHGYLWIAFYRLWKLINRK